MISRSGYVLVEQDPVRYQLENIVFDTDHERVELVEESVERNGWGKRDEGG